MDTKRTTKDQHETRITETQKCIEFIREVGIRLILPQETIATAMVLLYRFFSSFSLKNHDGQMIAAASVYVASKVNDTVRRLRDFVNVVYFIIYPKSSQPIGIGSSEIIVKHEVLLLRGLGFDVQVEFPYKYMLNYVKVLNGQKNSNSSLVLYLADISDFKLNKNVLDDPDSSSSSSSINQTGQNDSSGPISLSTPQTEILVKLAWSIINDSYMCPESIKFKPSQIAASALYLAMKFASVAVYKRENINISSDKSSGTTDVNKKELAKDIIILPQATHAESSSIQEPNDEISTEKIEKLDKWYHLFGLDDTILEEILQKILLLYKH